MLGYINEENPSYYYILLYIITILFISNESFQVRRDLFVLAFPILIDIMIIGPRKSLLRYMQSSHRSTRRVLGYLLRPRDPSGVAEGARAAGLFVY